MDDEPTVTFEIIPPDIAEWLNDKTRQLKSRKVNFAILITKSDDDFGVQAFGSETDAGLLRSIDKARRIAKQGMRKERDDGTA